MPINVHSNVKFLMPDGTTEVGIEDLENTIHTSDITDFDIQNPQDGMILRYDALNGVWRNLPLNLTITAMQDAIFSNLNDGDKLVWNSGMNRWTNSSYVPDALQGTYGGTAGIQAINWGGQVRPMNVDFWNGKAWAEVLVSADGVESAPWDNGWINSTTNKLQSFNLNASNGLAAYTSGLSSVLAVAEVTTNLLFTAKPSIDSGINTGAMLDLSHMTSANRQQFLDYFAGLIAGFEQADTFALTGGAGAFDTHMGFRNGSVQNDEWLIVDTLDGSSIGEPHWGYRSSGSSKGAKAAGSDISSTNVISIFATNY